MSKLITGAKTPEQLANMRECGRMLATIYQELRERVTASPLMDAPRFAGHFVQALHEMWAAREQS